MKLGFILDYLRFAFGVEPSGVERHCRGLASFLTWHIGRQRWGWVWRRSGVGHPSAGRESNAVVGIDVAQSRHVESVVRPTAAARSINQSLPKLRRLIELWDSLLLSRNLLETTLVCTEVKSQARDAYISAALALRKKEGRQELVLPLTQVQLRGSLYVATYLSLTSTYVSRLVSLSSIVRTLLDSRCADNVSIIIRLIAI